MNHTRHIIRFAVVLALIVAGFLAARSYMVPESFGVQQDYTYGYHRGDSDAEQAQRIVLYQGSDKCAGCHTEAAADWKTGKHAGVTCEACHGNWQAHNNNTKDKAGKDTSAAACLLCHAALDARPARFPQIADFARHMEEKGGTYEQGALCVDCHSAHNPKQ